MNIHSSTKVACLHDLQLEDIQKYALDNDLSTDPMGDEAKEHIHALRMAMNIASATRNDDLHLQATDEHANHLMNGFLLCMGVKPRTSVSYLTMADDIISYMGDTLTDPVTDTVNLEAPEVKRWEAFITITEAEMTKMFGDTEGQIDQDDVPYLFWVIYSEAFKRWLGDADG